MPGTLYLLGNGFDMAHGLHTSYADLYTIAATSRLSNTGTDLADFLDDNNVIWGDFEEGLSHIDLRHIAEEHFEGPDYMSDSEDDRQGVLDRAETLLDEIIGGISDCFEIMARRANEELAGFDQDDPSSASAGKPLPYPEDFLAPGDRAITFNYTSTLEALYDRPRDFEILHIHGHVEEGGDLIFGYGKEDEGVTAALDVGSEPFGHAPDPSEELQMDLDPYIEKQKVAALRCYRALKKPLQVDKLKRFLGSCDGIEDVVVLGQSMSDVDIPYFRIIDKALEPRWHIGVFGGYPSEERVRTLPLKGSLSFFDSAKGLPVL